MGDFQRLRLYLDNASLHLPENGFAFLQTKTNIFRSDACGFPIHLCHQPPLQNTAASRVSTHIRNSIKHIPSVIRLGCPVKPSGHPTDSMTAPMFDTVPLYKLSTANRSCLQVECCATVGLPKAECTDVMVSVLFFIGLLPSTLRIERRWARLQMT